MVTTTNQRPVVFGSINTYECEYTPNKAFKFCETLALVFVELHERIQC